MKGETLNTDSMNKIATNASNLIDWLIGDSLLRNVDSDNLPRNTKVECTLNNIGSLEGTLQYYHHTTPGEPLRGFPGVAW